MGSQRRLVAMVMGGDNCANNALVASIVKNAYLSGITQVLTPYYGVLGLLGGEQKITALHPEGIHTSQPDYGWGISREPLCFRDYPQLVKLGILEGSEGELAD